MSSISRPLCTCCSQNLAAINYIRDEVAHYRSKCSRCIRREKKLPPQLPSWVKAGYKKKPHCEQCGFRAKYKEQLFVYHIDGVLAHVHKSNLKTICANCQIEITKSGIGWIMGQLTPDF